MHICVRRSHVLSPSLKAENNTHFVTEQESIDNRQRTNVISAFILYMCDLTADRSPCYRDISHLKDF